MISVDEALAKIIAKIPRLESEDVACDEAAGRILAADITALRSHPAEDQSAMDGYALRHRDLSSLPATLDVIGEAPAGSAFAGHVGAGEAVRIFTGGAMPEGADTVVMQEDTQAADGRVTINSAPQPRTYESGRHVRLAGNDFRKGDMILRAGERMTARALGLAISAAGGTFPLTRRPRIALLATGDELVAPGVEPQKGQLVGANTPMLAALFEARGAQVIDLGIARDNAAELTELVRSHTDIDMLVTIGGASVGDYDLVQSALGSSDLGAGKLEVDFWRIAMRPGKPLIFGQLNGKPMLGLPGNPVSAFVCAYIFALAAIDAFQGATDIGPTQTMAVADVDLRENGSRQAYIRASLFAGDDGALRTAPLANQDSAALSSLAAADAFILRPVNAPATPAGAQVPVLLLDTR